MKGIMEDLRKKSSNKRTNKGRKEINEERRKEGSKEDT